MVSQPWMRPQWHTTIESTQTLLLSDPRPGAVVVADHQRAGIGRRGREWVAPPDTALAVSVAMRVPRPDRVGWVPLLAGLAVCRALAAQDLALTTVMKWPNDVMVPEPGIAGRHLAGTREPRPGKVCGVLAHVTGEMVVVGAGLNIDQSPEELPIPGATSWRLALGVDSLPGGVRAAWLEAYLAELAQLMDTLDEEVEAVARHYRSACDTLGREVVIHLPGGGRARGRAVALDTGGALVLQGGSGLSTHHVGDVVHLRHPASADTVSP